jgi:hypothetical protein
MTTNTTDRPALNRRTLLHRALAGAAGAAIGAPALGAITTADDPLPALLARRVAILRYMHDNDLPDYDPLFAEVNGIEERLETAVPTTREGVIAQLQYLLDFSEEGWDFDERLWKMVSNVVVGIKRLPMGAAA